MSGLVRCYNVADMTNENSTDEKKNEQLNERLVAQEMIRLSELRLDVQQEEVGAMERKAALLGTFCIAVIGYLLRDAAFDAKIVAEATSGRCHFWTAIAIITIKVIPSAILAGGVFYCWKTLIPATYKWKGLTLSVMVDKYPYRHDLTDILKGLVERYNDAAKSNDEVIREKKAENIKDAIKWGGRGVVISLFLVILEKIAPVLPVC